jgi:hypothetical protein
MAVRHRKPNADDDAAAMCGHWAGLPEAGNAHPVRSRW